MKWYYTIFDLNMSVGQYDRCLMVQWFCFISDRPFDIWKSYFQIIKWCYTVFHLSMTVSHCDLYFMVQWFCPVSERYSTDLFTLSARHNSGELCCHATALVVFPFVCSYVRSFFLPSRGICVRFTLKFLKWCISPQLHTRKHSYLDHSYPRGLAFTPWSRTPGG